MPVDVEHRSTRPLARSLLTTWKGGSLANAAVVEHAACVVDSASVWRKVGMPAGARQDS